MNKRILESQMKLHGDTARDLAEAIGITSVTFSVKINEKNAEFTQGEILKIKERYKLTPNQIDEIFFN